MFRQNAVSNIIWQKKWIFKIIFIYKFKLLAKEDIHKIMHQQMFLPVKT